MNLSSWFSRWLHVICLLFLVTSFINSIPSSNLDQDNDEDIIQQRNRPLQEKERIKRKKIRDQELVASLFPHINQTELKAKLDKHGSSLPVDDFEKEFYLELNSKTSTDAHNRGIVPESVSNWIKGLQSRFSEYLKENIEDGEGGLFSVFYTLITRKTCEPMKKEVCFHEDNLGCFGENLAHICRHPHKPKNIVIEYNLYSRKGFQKKSSYPLFDDSFTDKIANNSKQPNSMIALILHGFDSHSHKKEYEDIRKALLRTPLYENVLQVNYSRAVKGPDYIQAMANSEVVGRKIANFIIDLTERKQVASLEQIHLIGFSMGCQVAHFASDWIKIQTSGKKIGRVTGLDPAGVLTIRHPKSQITPKDARFVDVIHSSAGFEDGARVVPSFVFQRIGISEAVGHIDFYPNGGSTHPQCSITDFPACKHDQSLTYFFHSIHSCNYFSISCTDIDIFSSEVSKACKDAGKAGPGSRMGLYSFQKNPEGRGIQFLETTKKPPHCKQPKSLS